MQDEPNRERAAIAHVLRRCTFGPRPGQVESFAGSTPLDVVETLLADDGRYALTEDEVRDAVSSEGDPDDRMLTEFIVQMMNGEHLLHERLTWFWHTHFTTSLDDVSGRMVWAQHHLVRRHALGNFRDLATQITIDPAMLIYLNGESSRAENPNENYAREFMELFTLGRDQGYTEDDIKNAARAFSGWWVDWEDGSAHFEPEAHYSGPLTILGERRRWTAESLVAYVCALPACHRHIATRLYRHLVGVDPTADRLDELAAVFADNDLEIKPLVAAILRGPDFLDNAPRRTKQPLEWYLAVLHAYGFAELAAQGQIDDLPIEPWDLQALGQMPFLPPNVAGWPDDDRWSSASQVVSRTAIALGWDIPDHVVDRVEPTADAVLERCGIYAVSERTLAALVEIEESVAEYEGRLELLLATTLTSPEFALA